MRAVVVGGSGQIGSWLLRRLTHRGHEAIGTYASTPFPGLFPLDLARTSAEESAAWVLAQRPDVVFYPAGFTWVDACERDPDLAMASNCREPLNLALALADHGVRFVQFSTDYVFDGRAGPYDESAEPNPLSCYGRAKREAERLLADALGDLLLTIRTTWVFGPERQGKNFAYQLARALRQGQRLACPSDQVSTPSYAPDVASATLALVEAGTTGTIHVSGPDRLSRADFARRIAEAFGLDPELIDARPTSELGQTAPRPLESGLLTPRLDRLHPGLMRPLARTLPDFLARCRVPEDGWRDPLST